IMCRQYFFFFFQAEDGIRDRNVTGVQTCALPISRLPGVRREEGAARLQRSGLPTARDRRRTRRCVPGHDGDCPQRKEGRLALWEIGRASCRERVWVWEVGGGGK